MTRRRVAVGALGGLLGGTGLAGALAASPWRPSGLLVGLVVVGVLLPAATAVATRTALRVSGEPEDLARGAGRLAAVAAPVLVLLLVFTINLGYGLDRLAAQQVTALVAGVTAAAALGTRFADPTADDGPAEEGPAGDGRPGG